MSKNNFENNIYEQPDYNYGYFCPPIFRYPCDEDCDKASYDDRQTQSGMLDTSQADTSFQSTTEPILTDIGYTQAFLKTQIGKRVRITFLIGTTNLTDRVGILEKVGVSYIVLKVPESNIRTMCDLYAIKFVDIFEQQNIIPSQNMMGMPYMGPRLDFEPSED
ncbi:MAG: hypothetical protein N2448_06795 [Caloramator sp.]|nr:hypothetical protein [Caloramator sp.]